MELKLLLVMSFFSLVIVLNGTYQNILVYGQRKTVGMDNTERSERKNSDYEL